MSSMLEQAIIDADQLKETAKQTAEEAVVEKYQDEIKETIQKILEQDEDIDAEVTSDTDGTPKLELVDELPSAQLAEDDEIVQIDLNQLEEMMAEEQEEGDLDPDDMLDREQVAEELDTLAEEDGEVELDESVLSDILEEEDEVELDEESLAAIVAEMLGEGFATASDKDAAATEAAEGTEEAAQTGKVGEEEEEDTAFVSSTPTLEETAETEEEVVEEVVEEDDTTDLEETNVALVKETKTLAKENKSLLREQKRAERKVQLLNEKVDKYGTVIKQLKEKLNESNLTNAKLLYQNRILNSVSLNERQKDKIVEAISNATTVEEAKLIFETLQSAVGVSKKRTKRPESLNEVVTRSSSAFIPRKEVKPSTDAFSERMKRLAGLK